MKTTKLMIGVIVCLLLLSACQKEPAVSNREWIQSRVAAINSTFEDEGFAYRLEETDSIPEGGEYKVTLSDTEEIKVNFNTLDLDSEDYLFYNVEYYFAEENKPNWFVVLTVVNAISYKPFSEKFCKEFLATPEEKCSIERRGSVKSNNFLVAKYKNLDFFEEHGVIEYYQFSDRAFEHNAGDQELVFGGRTGK